MSSRSRLRRRPEPDVAAHPAGGAIGDDGYLTIQDRRKDVIITGGENV